MNERPSLSRTLDLVRLSFVPAALGLLLAIIPQRAAQYWWDVALGTLLARFHALPTHDPFSYVSADVEVFVQPWIGLFWLTSVHEISGLAGTLMLRNLLVMLTFGILAFVSYARTGRNGTATMAWCTALGIAFVLGVAEVGASVFTWPLAALAIALAVGVRRGRLPAWTTLGFVVLAAVWVNLAPRFVFAALVPAFFAMTTVRRDRKRAAWFGVAAVGAGLAAGAHPAGLAVFRHLADPGSIDLGLLILCGTQLDVRVFPFVGDTRGAEASRWLTIGLSLLLLTVSLGAQPWTAWHGKGLAAIRDDVRTSPPHEGWMPPEVPVEAVEILRSWGSQPRVFVPYEFAGYVAFELGREGGARPTIFISPWSPESAHELYRQAVDDAQVARGVLQQHKIQAAILDPARHEALVKALRESQRWVATHETSHSILFIRERPRGDT